ncbi:glycosyltransferase family 4 protein [Methanofollis tationis]|uniref:Glycosyltransferase family 4 protein n=1 Tax=Methanofollis tationis TaxID=81417 RepID=A0A7K4HLF7_9EURY|nr:glycosyltransferase family 4 protein [Methanofollis tationis]NVO66029.1 glycosyltransferase family 4 protein [Methanofollis tationis]
MSKVCMISTGHSPFDDRIFHKEAKSLEKAGYVVAVICQSDNDFSTILGNIKVEGIKRRGSGIIGELFVMGKLFLRSLNLNYDIYHCHEPQSLIVGLFLRFLCRKKIIYDVHEHWPSQISSRYGGLRKKIITNIVEKIEHKSRAYVSYFIVAPPNLKDRFSKDNIKNNVDILYVCPELGIFSHINDAIVREFIDRNTIVYEGNIDIKYRGLDVFVKSLPILAKHYPDLLYLIVGRMLISSAEMESLNQYLAEYEVCDHFTYTDWVEYPDVPSYLSASKLGVILLQPVSYNNIIGTPNKLFDYMAAGIPVVASDFPNIRSIVEDAQCGILVDPTDPQNIADSIAYLLNNPEIAISMGKNGRKAIESKYNWENMEQRLYRIYHEVSE